MLDGPATRPITPLAVENGVGKLAANVRLMSARERECGELPPPISSPSGRKTGRGHLFSGGTFHRNVLQIRGCRSNVLQEEIIQGKLSGLRAWEKILPGTAVGRKLIPLFRRN